MRRRARPHTDWCARDHRCNLAEHRSEEIVVELPGHGRAVLTRVLVDGGGEYADVRLRIALTPVEPTARRQLGTLLGDLRTLVTRAALAGRPTPARYRGAAE
ncbi:hypothetical protein [Polymorphospora sp. NPDC050346]|uniref:hypothetical protein n=1 Tax=Polymorphospora sp. NPDC050346 TaxID=3155780 RepID=UPI0033DC94F9